MKHTLKDVIILLEQTIDNKTRLLCEYQSRRTRTPFNNGAVDTFIEFLKINIGELNRIHTDLMSIYEETETVVDP